MKLPQSAQEDLVDGIKHEKAIFELLWAIYEYDDKPHRFHMKLEALISLFDIFYLFTEDEIKIIKNNINKIGGK